MALFTNSSEQKSILSSDHHGENHSGLTASDELTIQVIAKCKQESPMPEKLKQEKCASAPDLKDLFETTLKSKNEFDQARTKWVQTNEVEVEGLSQMTLHDFVLKAEGLGKKVSYTRSLTVKISD